MGKKLEDVQSQLKQTGIEPSFAQRLAPYKEFSGKNPSNTFLFESLDPYNLGFLIACYENKIFAQGVLWNIFSFDQWGVELGKEIANTLLPIIKSFKENANLDPSTMELIKKIKSWE